MVVRWVLTLPVCPYHVTTQGHNERCSITVADAGHISAVGTFAVESHGNCIYDYLEIGGTRYCGSTGPTEVLLQADAVINWVSDHSEGAAGWTICWAAVTPSPVESTTASPTTIVAPTSAPTRVPSAMPTVDSSLTVTSGEDDCHLVTVDGNPNCVTDGEGQTVRSRPSCGILDRRAGPPLTLGTVCVLRAHHRYFASMRPLVLRRSPLCVLIGGDAVGADVAGVPAPRHHAGPQRAL